METMILVVAAFTLGGMCGVALGVAIGLTGKEKGEGREQREAD